MEAEATGIGLLVYQRKGASISAIYGFGLWALASGLWPSSSRHPAHCDSLTVSSGCYTIGLHPTIPTPMTRSLWLTIDWQDADSQAPEAQQEAFTQSVLRALRAHDAIQRVERVPDPEVPTGGMGAQWLWNILTAEIPGDELREACQEALDQLEGKPVTFKVESGVVELSKRKTSILRTSIR